MAKTTSMDIIAVQLEDVAKDITGTTIAKGGYAWDIIDNALTTIAEAVGAELPTKKYAAKKDRVADVVEAIADADVGGGGGENLSALVARTISGVYENSTASTVGSYAFYGCTSLTEVSFPACTTIGNFAFYSCPSLTTVSFPTCTIIRSNAFRNCTGLTTANFPACTSINTWAFDNCSNLTTVSFPACTFIDQQAFKSCTSLTTASFPTCTSIGALAFIGCTGLTTVSLPACTIIDLSAFASCYRLLSLYLTGSSVVTLVGINAFSSTPIGGYTEYTGGVYGSIYVPSSMLASYKNYQTWKPLSSRIVAYDG